MARGPTPGPSRFVDYFQLGPHSSFVPGLRSTGFAAAGGGCAAAEGSYFVSRCDVCVRQKRQYFRNSSRSVVFFLFLVVE